MIRRTLRVILVARPDLGGNDQQPQVRILAEQPSAEQADQGRLAGVAEHHQQQAPIARRPALVEPRRHALVHVRRRPALLQIPGDHEMAEGDGRRSRAAEGGGPARRARRTAWAPSACRRSIEQAPTDSGRRRSCCRARSSARRNPAGCGGCARRSCVGCRRCANRTCCCARRRAPGSPRPGPPRMASAEPPDRADPGTAGARPLLRQAAAQRLLLLALILRVTEHDRLELTDRAPGGAPCFRPAGPAGSRRD